MGALTPQGAPPPLKKIKFFVYGAIFMTFEKQYYYMFTNNG